MFTFTDKPSGRLRKTILLAAMLAVAVAIGTGIGGMGEGKSNVFADGGQEAMKQTITVTGTGELQAAPDIAYVDVAVETRESTAKAAQSSNAQTFDRLKKVLYDSYKLAQKDVETTGFYVQPEYQYNEKDGTNKITGYTATHRIEITMRDLNRIGQLLDDLSTAGANRVEGVHFDTEKQDQYELQALDKAMDNAKAKADALAKAAGKKVVDVISIVQNGTSSGPINYGGFQMKAAADGAASTSVETGQISLSSSVTVIYGMK